MQELSLKDNSAYMCIMQKIEKFFPHSTMTEFMAALNETTLDGVYTIRLTPKKFKIDPKNYFVDPHWGDKDIIEWLEQLQAHNVFTKCLCFKEEGPKVGTHYHARLLTKFKTRKSVSDLIKKHFPIGDAGNEAYSVRDCKAKDKTIWKSATYIAKDNDCIYKYGYSNEDVNYFNEYSKRLRKFKDTPKYEQIIYIHGLDARGIDLRASHIYNAIIDFHKSKKIEIPPPFRVNNLMHNICFKLNANYRRAMKEHICIGYDQKMLGEFTY